MASVLNKYNDEKAEILNYHLFVAEVNCVGNSYRY